jgi:hypothetical protein
MAVSIGCREMLSAINPLQGKYTGNAIRFGAIAQQEYLHRFASMKPYQAPVLYQARRKRQWI